MSRRRIGLLGGSFNPAHEGHRQISLMALKRLKLNEVWWMVSPQNPLKRAKDMAPLEERLNFASALANHPRIRVTDIERNLGTRYTVDTIGALRLRFSGARFVWLMGADNLVQICRWRNWKTIFESVAIAVFTRPPYSITALSSQAARYYAACRLPEAHASALVSARPPAWIFLHGRPHPESATRIRTRTARTARAEEHKENTRDPAA